MFDNLKEPIKIIFSENEVVISDTNWYWDDYGVRFSKERFERVAKFYFEVQQGNQKLYDIDSEKFAQEILSPDQNLIEQQIKE